MNYLWWILIGGVILLIILAILFFTKSNSKPSVTLYTNNITSTTVDLEWTSSKSTDTDTFDVYQDNDDVDDDEIFSGITGNNVTVVNLTPDTEYSFYVILNNNYKSNTKTITTFNNTPGLTGKYESNKVTLEWQPFEDASDYTIFKKYDQSPTTTIPGITGTSYIDDDLKPNNTYSYYLIAYVDDVAYGPSNTVVLPITLQAPILKVTDITETTVDLSWNDNSIITYYKIYRDDEEIEKVEGDITDYTDDGLTLDTTYNYQIVAFFDDDVYKESNIIPVTPSTRPDIADWMAIFSTMQTFSEYTNPSEIYTDLTLYIKKAGPNTNDLFITLSGKYVEEPQEPIAFPATFTETTVVPDPHGDLYAVKKITYEPSGHVGLEVGKLLVNKNMGTNEYTVILEIAVGIDSRTGDLEWATFVFK